MVSQGLFHWFNVPDSFGTVWQMELKALLNSKTY